MASRASRFIPCAFRSFAFGTVLALGVGTAAHAGPIISYSITGGSDPTFNFNENGVPAAAPPGWYQYTNSNAGFAGGLSGTGWNITWNYVASDNADNVAGLSPAFTVVNSSTATQHFSIMVTLPTIPTTILAALGGANITLTPPEGGSATVGDDPGSIFTYFVNGNPITTLYDDPYSLSATSPVVAIAPPANFSPAQSAAFVGLTPTTIAILIDFDLTAGATVQVSGTLQYIPAPGALALLGLAGFAGRRRRRA